MTESRIHRKTGKRFACTLSGTLREIGVTGQRGARFALALALALLASTPTIAQEASAGFDAAIAESAQAMNGGDWTKAEAGAREALALATQSEGADSYQADAARFQLAMAVNGAGRPDEAAALYAQCVAWRTARFGAAHGLTAQAAYRVAEIRLIQKRYPEARDAIDQAIAGFETGRDQKFFRDWLSLSYGLSVVVATGMADHPRRVDDYRKLIALFGLDGRSAVTEADYRIMLGQALHDAGRFEEAIAALGEGIAARKALGNADGAQLNWALYLMGWDLFYRTTREAEAVAPLREACEGYRKLGPAQDQMTDACLGVLADALDYTRAVQELVLVRREIMARSRARDGLASPSALSATAALAEALFKSNATEEAVALLQQTLARKDVRSAPAADAANLHFLLGSILSAGGDPAGAVREMRLGAAPLEGLPARRADYFRAQVFLAASLIQTNAASEADAIIQKLLPAMRSAPEEEREFLGLAEATASSLDQIFGRSAATGNAARPDDNPLAEALLAFSRDDYPAAIPGLRKTIDEITPLLGSGGGSPALRGQLAFVQSLLGLALGFDGQKAEAETVLRAALASFGDKTPPELLYNKGIASQFLGTIVADRGDAVAAIPLFAAAVDIFNSRVSANDGMRIFSLEMLAQARREVDPSDPQPLLLLAKAALIARQSSERVSLGLDAGTDPAQQALARATAGGRISNSPLRDIYAEYLAEARRVEDLGRPADRSTILMVMQDLSATNAGQAMRATAARLAQGDGPGAAQAREQSDLAEQARQLAMALAEARQGMDFGRISQLEEQQSEVATRLAAVDRQIDAKNPGYALLLAPKSIDLPTLRKRLRPGEALLLLSGGGELSQFVLSVSADGFAWQEVKRQDLVEQDVSTLRCSLDRKNCPEGTAGGADSPFAADAAFGLYQRLIEPVAGPLAGKRTIYVAASGRIGELPLATLLTRPPGSDAAPAWFGDQHDIVLLPSVAALRAPGLERPDPGETPYLGYGAPDMGSGGGDFAMPVKDLADPKWLRSTFSALPNTRLELRKVSKEMGVALGMVRTGSEATENAFRNDPDLSEAQVVHLATHGYLPDPSSGQGLREPGIVFTPPAVPSAADDGVLTASEIAMLRLRADWLLLSACDTATAGGGDGSIADADALGLLARAFLYAGARRMVASHWRLSDETAPVLLVTMLHEMKANPAMTPAAALSAAEQAVRTGKHADGRAVEGWRPAWRHPFFWAPLSLIAADNDR